MAGGSTPPAATTRERLCVGCMTGTSLDGLDAAIVRIRGSGLAMRAEFVAGVSESLGPPAARLRDLAEQVPMSAGAIASLSREFALLHAGVVQELLRSSGIERSRVSLVSVHGQTVFHQPPASWQMFSPAVLAHELGVPVVTDLRGADLAAGGQGAPITPLADWVFFRADESTAIVNLGGFCNITLLGSDDAADPGASVAGIRGFDLCACNHLLDTLARVLLGKPYDAGGAAALAGTPEPEALGELSRLLEGQSRSGRSLGTGDELGAFIQRRRNGVSAADLCATACAALGSRIAAACGESGRVLLAGGGTRNVALLNAIERACAGRVSETDAAGLPAEFREA
ncbi:MAG: anhydro-N-acetylmuramic acid kinase, partial [Phycisphaerales bacterium]|nr:anhydro-N-acetylmuramic acid kinase [Phycisphaerales bacterium]